jgi:hypothetical protein
VTGVGSAPLGNGDAMEGRIDLAVAAAAESEVSCVPRPHRDRRGSIPRGEGRLGTKSLGASSLADDLRGGESCTALQRKQRWRDSLHKLGNLTFKLVSAERQLATPAQELSTDVHQGAVQVLKALFKAAQDVLNAEGLGCYHQARKQFVEMPAQPALDTGPFRYQVVTMID